MMIRKKEGEKRARRRKQKIEQQKRKEVKDRKTEGERLR